MRRSVIEVQTWHQLSFNYVRRAKQGQLAKAEAGKGGRRRNKLLDKLREQLLIVRSDFGGEPYKPRKRVWLTNETGEKELVERDKKVRRWYWRNGDKWFFQLRYGAKVLDLGKGRNAVEVDNEDALIEAIDICSAAVKSGELDKALQEVAEIKSKRL